MNTSNEVDKTEFKQKVVSDLYLVPREKLSVAIANIVLKTAKKSGAFKSENTAYYVIYNGANFYSKYCEHSWQATEVPLLPEYEKELEPIYKLTEDLLHEISEIKSYVQLLLNNVNVMDDIPYLFPDTLSEYFPISSVTKNPSDHARKFKSANGALLIEKEAKLKQRILANVLIQNI